jgi:hypothetical protein
MTIACSHRLTVGLKTSESEAHSRAHDASDGDKQTNGISTIAEEKCPSSAGV